MTKASVELLVELAKIRFRSAAARVRLSLLARLAARLPTELLDDTRLAVTDELARRGLHVITHRTRPRKVA